MSQVVGDKTLSVLPNIIRQGKYFHKQAQCNTIHQTLYDIKYIYKQTQWNTTNQTLLDRGNTKQANRYYY